jgi:cytidine deaminase
VPASSRGPAAGSADDRLVTAAAAVRRKAYAPYSGYPVGAALLDVDGRVHVGCNIENAAYPAGICAERAALAAAVSSGARAFVALAVVVGGRQPAAPCGLCRQALAELSPELRIVLAALDPAGTDHRETARQAVRLDDLLPLRFGPAALGAAGARADAGAGLPDTAQADEDVDFGARVDTDRDGDSGGRPERGS